MFTEGMFKAPVIRLAEEVSRRGLATYLLANTFYARDIYGSPNNVTGPLHIYIVCYVTRIIVSSLFTLVIYTQTMQLPYYSDHHQYILSSHSLF